MINRRPLMGASTVDDLQNNGYKSTASAIAELVDNSIQAKSKNVDIVMISDITANLSPVVEILVIDDGVGMDHDEFNTALPMASSTRNQAGRGLGRYGMGLPNASISQTKRVEVYTKKKGSKYLFNYLDLVEIKENDDPYLPDVVEVNEIDIDIVKKGAYKVKSNRGTIVRWVKPNRLRPKTPRYLKDHLNDLLGRIFRYYIKGFENWEGTYEKCNVSVLVFEYNGNSYSQNKTLTKTLKPFDPLFSMSGTQLEDEISADFSEATSEELAPMYDKVFEQTLEDGTIKQHRIQILFTHVKEEIRRKLGEGGKNPGNSKLGEKYKYRNLEKRFAYNNISVVRAFREIDCHSFGFIGDISDPTHRWWSIEIRIDSVSDELFGIDNRKQQVTKLKALEDEEQAYESEFEDEFFHNLSDLLVNNVRELKNAVDSQTQKPKLPPDPSGPDEEEPDFTEDVIPDSEIDEVEIDDEQTERLKEWIDLRFEELSDQDKEKILEWALTLRQSFVVVYTSLGDTLVYKYSPFSDIILVEINNNHPFYKKFIAPLEMDETSNSKEKKHLIFLLICSLVKAQYSIRKIDGSDKIIRRFNNSFGDSLFDYIEDLEKYGN